MTGRERFLTAIANGKPDRLPCQVHNWMQYYLDTYLNGMDVFEAYEYFDMDPVIYACGAFEFNPHDISNWQFKQTKLGMDKDGNDHWVNEWTTPEGVLRTKGATNKFTSWETEPLIKTEADFELFRKYYPVPVGIDWSPILEIKKRIGDRGIVRGYMYNYGQLSPWQSICCLLGTEESIFKAIDEPDWMHYALGVIEEKYIGAAKNCKSIELDLVETGGGAGSSTVISPDMHKEFCLPYDKRYHDVLHELGAKVVYHLCGGNMPLLEMVADNGTDMFETMTPPSMGGDCRMREAKERVGKRIGFIGGFDQNAGFERGNPENVREQVQKLHEANKEGGYICSPSDHFFFGNPENVRAFADECKKCKY